MTVSSPTLPGTDFGTAVPGAPAPIDTPPVLTIETLSSGARLVRTRGPMDRRNSLRLLRLVDAELTSVRAGRRTVQTLLVDLSHLDRCRTYPSVACALDALAQECAT